MEQWTPGTAVTMVAKHEWVLQSVWTQTQTTTAIRDTASPWPAEGSNVVEFQLWDSARDRAQGRQEGTYLVTKIIIMDNKFWLRGTTVDEDGIVRWESGEYHKNLHHLIYVVALIIIFLALLVKLPKFFSQYIITGTVGGWGYTWCNEHSLCIM